MEFCEPWRRTSARPARRFSTAYRQLGLTGSDPLIRVFVSFPPQADPPMEGAAFCSILRNPDGLNKRSQRPPRESRPAQDARGRDWVVRPASNVQRRTSFRTSTCPAVAPERRRMFDVRRSFAVFAALVFNSPGSGRLNRRSPRTPRESRPAQDARGMNCDERPTPNIQRPSALRRSMFSVRRSILRNPDVLNRSSPRPPRKSRPAQDARGSEDHLRRVPWV